MKIGLIFKQKKQSKLNPFQQVSLILLCSYLYQAPTEDDTAKKDQGPRDKE